MDISNVYAANSSSDTLSVFLRNTSSGALSGTNTIGTGDHPDLVVVSPDGKNVYTTNEFGHTISVFDRNLTSGDLSYNSTINASEYPGSSPVGISISPDGKNVYVGCFNINRISIFDRDLITGALTFNNSIGFVGSPWGIVVSLDGLNVYVVSSTQNELFMFSRDISTGLLSYIFANTPTGGLAVGTNPTSICISSDDLFVYVLNTFSYSISAFSRNGGVLFDSVGGPYLTGNANNPYGICISADGKNVYTSNISSNNISVFDRSTSLGTLTLTDSVSALNGIIHIAISADGKNVYTSNAGSSNNVSIFDRDLITGALSGTTTIATGTAPFGIAVFTNSFSPVQTALLIDVQPYGVVSGDPFTTQPIIKIVDSNGDLVPTATNDVEVTITVVNGSGSLTGTTTVTAVDGYATFTDLVFTGAGSFYLTFTSTGLTEVDSDEIATLTPTELVVYVQPFANISGQLLSTQPTIKIVNWLGDLVPDATDVVDVSLVDVTGSSALTGTLNATASGGYAAFTDLIATGYGSFYLTFTSGTLTSVNSDTLFFTPDPGNPNPPIPVKPKRSYTPLSVPTSGDMETNEFAINVADKKGYVRDSNGIIHLVFDGNASGSGTVTSVGLSSTNSTLTISDSPVTTSGTIKIDLPETGVSAKSYTNADITIDVYGRITAASDGAAGVTSIIAGTGVSVDTATGDVTVTNSLPDQTVTLTDGTGISVTGTYPDFTITNDAPDQTVTLTDGTGISVTGTYPDFTITNSLPDQTVSLTQGTDITITGTYPDFTIAYSGVAGGVTSIIAGTGISVDVSTGDVTITNSAPDQTVSITSGTGINVTGTYPDFTIDSTITQYTDSDARLSLSAGTGISYDNATGIITNSEPDQIVSLTGGTDISVTGTYPTFTVDYTGTNSGVTSIIAGTGISVDQATGAVTVTNTDPDQIVSITSGTGISVTGTYPSFTIDSTITQYTDSDARLSLSAGTGISYDNATGVITNSAPDQTVSLTEGTDITITGTYPSFTIAYSGTSSGVSSITAGAGISVDVTTGAVTVTNSSPDQTVSLTDGTGITVTGTYPSFTIATTITQYTDTDARKSLSAGTGISYDDATGVITNSSPDQTVSLTDGTGITVTGTYPSFTITNSLPDQTVSLTDGTDISITGTYPNFTISYTGTSSSGTVTSISTTSPITGGTITGTGTIGINASSANTASFVVQRDASGNFSAGTITASLTGTASTATNLAGGGAGQVPYQSASGTTAMLAAGTSGQVLTSSGASAPTWSNIIPSGTIMQYAGSTAPTGYLLCDGSAVSRTTYAALFAVTNTTYGAGNGSTTFNLPDLRGRLAMGSGTGLGLNASGTGVTSGTAMTARALGAWFGEETHLLTTAELASHTHANTVSGGNTSTAGGSHTHAPSGGSLFWVYNAAGGNTVSNTSPVFKMSADSSTATTASTNIDHTHTFTPSISNVAAGSNSRHATISPVLVVNYIIKT